MRLKNGNFCSMEIVLRSGTKVRADDEGCIEVDNEADAQFLLTHAGYKPVAARAPRSSVTEATPTAGPASGDQSDSKTTEAGRQEAAGSPKGAEAGGGAPESSAAVSESPASSGRRRPKAPEPA